MTTTLQLASQDEDNWTLGARLVNKLIFKGNVNGERKIALVLVFIDINGRPFEIKTWSVKQIDRRKKIYTVYRKVVEDGFYEIQATKSGCYFRSPKAEFSTSDLEYSAGWWLESIDSLRMNRYLDCSTNIQSSMGALNKEKPVNLLGSFVSLKIGPPANVERGKVTVQGYFVTLMDDNGRLFGALIWHSVTVDRSKFSLFEARKGDTILIFSARHGNPPSNASKDKVYVTTCYRPVVNSKCVSPKRINALKEAFRFAREASA